MALYMGYAMSVYCIWLCNVSAVCNAPVCMGYVMAILLYM